MSDVGPPVIIDTPTARVLPRRGDRVKAIVLHTTGETDLDKILRFYTAADGLQPHYVVEVTGTVRRIVAEDHVAYHCRIDDHEARLYMLGYATWSQWTWDGERPVHAGAEFTGYRQWREDWFEAKGVHSPLELVTGSHPNGRSVGVELQQPMYPTPDAFTGEQYASLSRLVADIGARHDVALDRDHVLTHYDCSPMRRSNARGSTDPGRDFRFARLWDSLRVLAPMS